MAADGNLVGAATTSAPKTWADVRAWLDAYRAKTWPGQDHVSVAQALNAFRVTTRPLDGGKCAIFMKDEEGASWLDAGKVCLYPTGLSERMLSNVFSWAIGMCVLVEMGVVVPDAVSCNEEGSGTWDSADAIGAALLVSDALIDRAVPASLGLRASYNTTCARHLDTTGLAVDAIVIALGGDAAIEDLGDCYEAIIDSAVTSASNGGAFVTEMLEGLSPEEDSSDDNDSHHTDARVRLPLILGRDAATGLLPSYLLGSLALLNVARAAGVRIVVGDNLTSRGTWDGGHRVFVDPDGELRVYTQLPSTCQPNRRWSAGTCTTIATGIGLAVMCHYGLITRNDIADDDIDYALAGEIGAAVLVTKEAVEAATNKAAEAEADLGLCVLTRDALIAAHAQRRTGDDYDLSEIFHVVAHLSFGENPYNANGELSL